MEQIHVFIKYEEFEDHDLHCVKGWVRVNTEVSDENVFEESEYKDEEGRLWMNPILIILLFMQLIESI